MIFVCVSCGKKFLYRGDPSAAPSCKACGGEIRPEGPTAAYAAAAPDSRTKDLDARVAQLEADLQAREKELQETRGRLATVESDSQGAGAQIEALQTPLSEAEDRQERVGAERRQQIGQARARIAQLEKEIQTVRNESSAKLQMSVVRSLKEKEAEIHEAQASIARYGEELKKAQELYKEALVKRDRTAEEHAAATAEAQASIARLGEDLKKAQDAYKEALKRKDAELAEAHEKAVALERRLAEIAARGAETGSSDKLGAQLTATRAQLDESARDLDRAQARIKQLEKSVLDADRRCGELQRKVEEAEVRNGAAADAGEAVAKLQSDLEAQRSESEQLRRRLADLDAAHRAGEAQASEGFRASVKEARYVAEDLGRNFESLAATMAGLVERVRRLVECLHQPEPEVPKHVIPGSAAARAETPPGPGMLPSQAVPAEDIPVIDSLPAPAPAEAGGHLPADDTILEMGGAVRPVRAGPEELPEPQEGAPLDAVPLSGAPEEAQVSEVEAFPGEAPPDEGGQYEAAPPAPEPEEAPVPEPPPKKKGFFSKLFGRK